MKIIWRSHDIKFAESDACDFYKEPTKNDCIKYKGQNHGWRKQVPYIVDENDIAHSTYNRIFIKRVF